MRLDAPTYPDDLPERLTEKELARHWRVTQRTLQRKRETGDGPPWLKIGGRVLYPRSDLLEYEASHRFGGGNQ